MSISPRSKFRLAMLLLMLVAWVLMGLWLWTEKNLFAFLLVPVLIVGTFLIRTIACPRCGTPLAYKGSAFGLNMEGGWSTSHCKKCNFDLRTLDK